MTQQKKVRDWFLDPIKYCKEIDHEQKTYPDKCIYHLTKSHPTQDCSVKRECERIRAQKSSGVSQNQSSTNSSGRLHHITNDVFEDAVLPDDLLVADETTGNDTKEDTLLYFACISNHYLHLVKNSSSPVQLPHHIMSCSIIIDSGANYHMFRDKAFFENLTPSSGSVYLGDGKTTLPIQGVGTVRCQIGSHMLTIPNVCYIPTLSDNIYSLFQHIQGPDHRLESSYDNGMFLIFPTFRTKAIIGNHDIYLDAIPPSSSHDATPSWSDAPTSSTIVCHNIMNFQNSVKQETDNLDNILHDLRRYYAEVKTK